MNTHLIRRAHSADYSIIRTLLESEDLPNEDVTIEGIPHFYVASLVDGSLMGCVAIEQYGTDALLRSLAVADGARRNGLGRTLVAAAEQAAIAHGVRRLFLLTTTAANYFASIGYHKFERAVAPSRIQSTSQFASLCPASATCMAKTL
ncbi:GNAT family N-acetyltransferase [Burkholderia pyrrocinia]|uniref:GNAT family N-acetyltransferase n=1 Tax=Burkholderia pyrrocinia TaxID=60550 RepID=A0A2Z5MZS8_BURPY|nr:arsenic resistance N-acetyltransferase ArsN2 [Burkholderia pyrrocinia]AXF22762.1 GNAT family N-acetyltransferase [Burkholderia pyrrocinia]